MAHATRSKAVQPSNISRATRSQGVPIPDIPLPATRKRKTATSEGKAVRAAPKKNATKRTEEMDTTQDTGGDENPTETRVEGESNATVENEQTAPLDGPQAPALPPVSSPVTRPKPRPRPPQPAGSRPVNDIDDLFISKRAGFRVLSSPMRVDQRTENPSLHQSTTMASSHILRHRSATPYNDDDAENECLQEEDEADVNVEISAKSAGSKDPTGEDDDEDESRTEDDEEHEACAEDDDEHEAGAEGDDELEPPAEGDDEHEAGAEGDDELGPPAEGNEFTERDESPADDNDADRHEPLANEVDKAAMNESATNDRDARVTPGETAEDRFIEDDPAQDNELTTDDEHAGPSHDMDVAHDSGSDESDYGETQARKEEIRRIQILKGFIRSRSPTNQELEEEDLEDDADYAKEAVLESSPHIRAAAKGKKSAALQRDDLSDDEDYQDLDTANARSDGGDIEDEDPEDLYPRRAGPLPAAARDAAFALHKKYDREMTAIARKYGKPPQSLFRLVGQDISIPRAISVWNAYQAWYASHGEIEKPKDMSAAEWTKIVQREFQAARNGLSDPEDAEAVAELFRPQVEWYRERLQAFVSESKEKKTFDLTVAKAAKQYTNMSVQLYETTGLISFGFIIDLSMDARGGHSSCCWGGAPPYLQAREEHKTTIATQLRDYVNLFQRNEMKAAGLDAEKSLFPIQTEAKENESARDRDARVFGEFLRHDLAKILYERSDNSLSLSKLSKVRLSWSNWADFAYEKQIILQNWFNDGTYPGGDSFAKNGLRGARAATAVAARKKALEDPAVYIDIVEIISWTEEERKLPLEQQRDIPLVLTLNGTVLLSVSDSTKYRQDLKKKSSSRPSAKTVNPRRQDRQRAGVNYESDEPQQRPPAASPAPQRSRTRRQPHELDLDTEEPVRRAPQHAHRVSPVPRRSHTQVQHRNQDSDAEDYVRMPHARTASPTPGVPRTHLQHHDPGFDSEQVQVQPRPRNLSPPHHSYLQHRNFDSDSEYIRVPPPQHVRAASSAPQASGRQHRGANSDSRHVRVPQHVRAASPAPQAPRHHLQHHRLDEGSEYVRVPHVAQHAFASSQVPAASRAHLQHLNLDSEFEQIRVPQHGLAQSHVHQPSHTTEAQPLRRALHVIEENPSRVRARHQSVDLEERGIAPEGRPYKRARMLSPPRQHAAHLSPPAATLPRIDLSRVGPRRVDFTKMPSKGVRAPIK